MTVLDAINQIGGALGTAGAGVAGWVATKINEVKVAAAQAEQARVQCEAALKSMRAELEALDLLKRGIRLEIQARDEHPYRGSSPAIAHDEPTNGELGRRLDLLERRLEELKGELVRERGARHAMQHQLSQDARQDEQQWREMLRSLGEIQGQLRPRGREGK